MEPPRTQWGQMGQVLLSSEGCRNPQGGSSERSVDRSWLWETRDEQGPAAR